MHFVLLYPTHSSQSRAFDLSSISNNFFITTILFLQKIATTYVNFQLT